MDIKDLKILNIRNGSSGNSITQRSVSDMVASGGFGGRSGGGARSAGAPASSAPMAVPGRVEHRAGDGHGSPQQHCSKSYGEKHMDVVGQTKGFRRRHNSCKYLMDTHTTEHRTHINTEEPYQVGL